MTVVQTFQPEHPALVCLKGGKDAGFYPALEVRAREELGYPPHRLLTYIEVAARDRTRAAQAAQEVADTLHGAGALAAEVLGPAPGPLARVRGVYTYQLLLRTRSEERLNELLAVLDPEDAPRTLIGFAGMGVNAQQQGYEPAGFVIDRRQRFDHPASETAVSIDELAIVVSRDSVHRIDPAFGWHLWATDLCITAICTHKVFPRIVRLPLFHNSSNDHQLPAAFHASAARLAAKHPGFGPIATLCGTIDERFLQQHRSQAA